jgi:hypothetical protein
MTPILKWRAAFPHTAMGAPHGELSTFCGITFLARRTAPQGLSHFQVTDPRGIGMIAARMLAGFLAHTGGSFLL